MHTQWQQHLQEWLENHRQLTAEGDTASYIPALQQVNPSHLGICITGRDGTRMAAGEWDVPFTLQSIAKVFSFVAVCMHHGVSHVLERVDLEPTGDPFNSIVRLEIHRPGKPFNPFINAGAITVASLLPGTKTIDKVNYVTAILEKILDKRPASNEEVYQSEWASANRNRALAYYLKELGYLETEVDHALEVYFRLCSLEVTTEELSMLGLVFALDGHHPVLREQILPKEIVRITNALMLTCGMYNSSGKFAAFVGVPAKSGVAGGIMATVVPRFRSDVLPFQDGCGIAVFGPAIDEYGNSRAGVALLQHVVQEWDLSIF